MGHIWSAMTAATRLDELRSMTPAEGEMPGESDIAELIESLPKLDRFGSRIGDEWMKGFIAHGLLTGRPSTTPLSGASIGSAESIRQMRRLAGQTAS